MNNMTAPYGFDFSQQMTAQQALDRLLSKGIISEENFVRIIPATDENALVQMNDELLLKRISNEVNQKIITELKCEMLRDDSDEIDNDQDWNLFSYSYFGLSDFLPKSTITEQHQNEYYLLMREEAFHTECIYMIQSTTGQYYDHSGLLKPFSMLDTSLYYPNMKECKQALKQLREDGKISVTDGFIQRMFFKALLSCE